MPRNSASTTKFEWKNLISIAIFGFLFFGFPRVEQQLVGFAQYWIDSLGIWAPIGYIFTGVMATVVAPIGLGPINVVLQRAFGFWPAVSYYWIYETIGMSINFWISSKFGNKLIKYFFYSGNDELMRVDPIGKTTHYMLDKSYWSAFVCLLGFGGELISYLAGLSKLHYLKFLSILIFTNFINALLFVGSNLSIGTDNVRYTLLQTISFGVTFIPVIIFFRKEIGSYITRIYGLWKKDRAQDKLFTTQILSFKNGQMSQADFQINFNTQIETEIQSNLDILSAMFPGYAQAQTDIHNKNLKKECLTRAYKKTAKYLPSHAASSIYQEAKKYLNYR